MVQWTIWGVGRQHSKLKHPNRDYGNLVPEAGVIGHKLNFGKHDNEKTILFASYFNGCRLWIF